MAVAADEDVADVSGEATARANILFAEGRRLLAAGDIAAACARFQESQRLLPRGGTLLNLGLCHEREGKLAQARDELRAALDIARRGGRADREPIAAEHLAAVEARLSGSVEDGVGTLMRPHPSPGQLRVSSVPEGARVTLDHHYEGTAPVVVGPVAPGAHRLRVEMDGRFPLEREVHVDSARSLLVTIDRNDLAARRTWAPYLAYGAAVAAVVVLSAAALFGSAARADPTGDNREEAQRDLERRKQYATFANVLFGTGAALGGTSLFTFLRFRRDVAGE